MLKKSLLLLCSLCLILSACGAPPEEPTPPAEEPSAAPESTPIQVSNLADPDTRELAVSLLRSADVTEPRIQQFLTHVDQLNNVMPPEVLTEGFVSQDPLSPSYDPYDLQDLWDQAYPDFMGYNCRITAYSLFADFLDIPADAEVRDDPLLFDLTALDEDPSAFPGETAAFSALFSSVPTEPVKEIDTHVAALQADWQARGITFRDNPKLRLISVVFHSIEEEDSYLFVGHTGLLLPAQDGTLYFLEKLAFQEPYQLVHFPDRQALSDYLMIKYNVSYNQPTADPFLMENDQRMSL